MPSEQSQYYDSMFFDMEKAGHSGSENSGEILTRGGVLTVHLKNVGAGGASPTKVWTITIYDSILELRESSASVYS